MLSPLPRRSDWVHASLSSPVVSAFPEMAVGSACAMSFSRIAQRSLTLRPAHSRCHQFVTRVTGGFNHFVTSTVAPVASGCSGCRVGLAPTGKAPPYHGARQKRSLRSGRSVNPPRELAQPLITVRLSAQSSTVRDTEDRIWYEIGSPAPGSMAAPVSKLIQTLRNR